MLLRIDDIVSGIAQPKKKSDGEGRKAEDSDEYFGDGRDG